VAGSKSSVPHREPVIGRGAELEALADWLATPAATPIALVAGPAGIGKSVILAATLERAAASGWSTLSATAVEGENGLARVTVADLLAAVPVEQFDGVADDCRAILERLRSLSDDAPPDDRNAVTAFANLLAAWTGPLLISVDDVQWLDDQSALVVLYAARRVDRDDIRFLFGRREEEPQPLEPSLRDRTTVLRLGPLKASSTRGLVRERVGRIGREAMGTVVEAAAGNPLFALELAALLAAPGAQLRVPTSIGVLLRERLARLTPDSRRALLTVALSPGARLAETVAVVGIDAVDEALASNVLQQRGDVLAPTHPLLGTAALEDASLEEERELHRALAEVVTDDLRHCLHAARAASSPDEDLAAQFSAASERATRRGRRRAAVELAGHALRLTPATSDQRDDRLVALAIVCAHLGDIERALDLLDETPRLSTAALRARGWLLRTDLAAVPLSELEQYVAHAAEEVGDDPLLRALVLVQLASFASRGSLTGLLTAETRAAEALALAEPDEETFRRALFELAWVRAERCLAIDDLLAAEASRPHASMLVVYSIERVESVSRMWRGDLATASGSFADLMREAEERGESEAISVLLIQQAECHLRAGRWSDAEGCVDQLGISLPLQDIDPTILRVRALAAAGRGEVETARELAMRAIDFSVEGELHWQEFEARRAAALAALLSGDHHEACDVLQPMWEHLSIAGFADLGAFPFAAELAEALVVTDGAGVDKARAIAAALRSLPDHPWAEAAAYAVDGHAETTAGELERAVASFQLAADSFGSLGFRFDEARALAYGGVASRRQRQLRTAKRLLGEAIRQFAEIGSAGWEAWARSELARVGGRPASGNVLTETERRVAVLVAQGNRNRDVAKALFVTESTIEATLSRVYTKLGIRSRTELAARMRRRDRRTDGLEENPPRQAL
jgi:DNA-binding CsgD family transcriptional regulator